MFLKKNQFFMKGKRFLLMYRSHGLQIRDIGALILYVFVIFPKHSFLASPPNLHRSAFPCYGL